MELVKRASLAASPADQQKAKGILQGGPLSPLLLNTCLDWFLDRRWKRTHPDTPLIRVADDLLILCRDRTEAQEGHAALGKMVREAGLAIKGVAEESIRDMAAGQRANWLGYSINWTKGTLGVQLPGKAWYGLEEHLRLAQDEADAPLAANESILSWISQQGAAYEEEDSKQLYAGIAQRAQELGFTEIPEREEVQQEWRAAHRRWMRLRRMVILKLRRESAAGSAQQHVLATDSGCLASQGLQPDLPGALSSSSARREVYVACDGACDPFRRNGGWGAVLVDLATGDRQCLSDSHPRTTNNRMELTAVVEALRALPEPCRVHLVVDSEYVQLGITKRLARWKQDNWRRRSRNQRKPIANMRLWQRLDALLQTHDVHCQWQRGHAGHPENELADQLAREAARSVWRVPTVGVKSTAEVEGNMQYG